MTNKNYAVTMSQKQYDDYLQYLTTAPNIQDVKKPNKKEFGEDNKHPTIKPVKLMEWLVKLTTNEGDVVLDPFSGSFTTGVACINTNRNFIGIEMNEEYCQYGQQRLEKAQEEWKLKNASSVEQNANTSEVSQELNSVQDSAISNTNQTTEP